MHDRPNTGAATSAVPTARRRAGGPPKGDRRREAILDAVEQLLREGSIRKLSVESIAAAAGISRSGFYFYFESKYAALAEALADVWDEMAEAATAFFAGSDDPPESYVPVAIAGVAELWRRHEPLLVGMFEASSTDPGARTLWDEWLERFVEACAERIEVERAAGRAPAGPPDAYGLARALLLMNERAFYDARRRALGPEDTQRIVDSVSAVWLAAVWHVRPAPL